MVKSAGSLPVEGDVGPPSSLVSQTAQHPTESRSQAFVRGAKQDLNLMDAARYSDETLKRTGVFHKAVEPSVNIVVNITSMFRIGLGTIYRYIHDVELKGVNDKDLRGLSGVLTARIGRFRKECRVSPGRLLLAASRYCSNREVPC